MTAPIVVRLVISVILGWLTIIAVIRFFDWLKGRIQGWRWNAPALNGAHDACGIDDDERAEAAAILALAAGDDEAIRDLDADITRRYGEQYEQPPRAEDHGAR